MTSYVLLALAPLVTVDVSSTGFEWEVVVSDEQSGEEKSFRTSTTSEFTALDFQCSFAPTDVIKGSWFSAQGAIVQCSHNGTDSALILSAHATRCVVPLSPASNVNAAMTAFASGDATLKLQRLVKGSSRSSAIRARCLK